MQFERPDLASYLAQVAGLITPYESVPRYRKLQMCADSIASFADAVRGCVHEQRTGGPRYGLTDDDGDRLTAQAELATYTASMSAWRVRLGSGKCDHAEQCKTSIEDAGREVPSSLLDFLSTRPENRPGELERDRLRRVRKMQAAPLPVDCPPMPTPKSYSAYDQLLSQFLKRRRLAL